MTDLSAVSQRDLKERRKSLRQQRRIKIVQNLWQMIAVTGLTMGLYWVATRPIWLLQSPAQVDVSGNEILSDEVIQALIPLQYPQPLLKVEPDAIAEQLEMRAPITEAVITRRLFPPTLKVHVQERRPVALTLPMGDADASSASGQTSYIQVGLLDAEGAWMPKSSFTLFDQATPLPQLKVQGMRERYRQDWPALFQAISQSPVEVSEIDWRDPSNLILKTALGDVHFGPYSARFREQLAALGQMRHLQNELGPQKVAYIDMSNPEMPSVQILQANQPPTASP